jgi:hypothetical protein
MSEAQLYSIRRLSPYQGTVQVMNVPGFRAMSVDGITWRVQILDQRSRLASYGIWRADGSGNVIDTGRTHALIEALTNQPGLPFPLVDTLELWLLDAEEKLPLAILNSTLAHRTPTRVIEVNWRASLNGGNDFVAPSLTRTDSEAKPHAGYISHSEVLNRCVRQAAGVRMRAQWFRREPDGSGTGLNGLRIDGLRDRKLAAGAFPELLLREDWSESSANDLVGDYHRWLAPNLLTHDNLSRPTRERLERAACKQPEKLYPLRRLLPEVINQDLVKIALVEAVIRGSA